ncbi:SDR family NAD(P)-dependent oxidoreductase [candidate division KSB1 bacterium]
MKGLKGKRVLITGGASGIGAATAKRFIDEGSEVIILDCDKGACEKIKQEISQLTATVIADVSNHKEVEKAFKEIDNIWGGLDILINNAGISIRHSFAEIKIEDWLKVINVNLNGVFFAAREAAIRMKRAGSGVIINMGSTNGIVGYKFYADYNASKAGVLELTRSLALELAPDIRVNAICPGYIMTPMQEAEYTPEMMAELNDKLPMKRHGTTGEVASLFAFLASDEASYITGQHYVIDGGETAGGLASR